MLSPYAGADVQAMLTTFRQGLRDLGYDDDKPGLRVHFVDAGTVDEIFKDANPGDLPIEQPTRVEMVINRKTAALLRLTIPAALLLQAERVID